MTHTTKKIISPSDELVFSLEARQIPIPILQTLFNENLIGSQLPIQTKKVKSIQALADMFLAINNLNLLIGVHEDYYLCPPRRRRANASANLMPVTPSPRRAWK